MADVITRFKLETTQYNSALRDATKGLKDIVHQTELAGNDFKEFSNRAIEAARALGQQATGATNAKDKVKELVSSYNEMAKTYNMMSDAMKKSEGGKALSASLQQLQQRINDAKAEMNATPGVLDKLASKFTVNVDALKLFNWGLQAAEGALKVAKDAFFNNEEQLDEWGRMVESSDSLYKGFLNSLNTGDISGYLQNIGNIVQAARDAYDALDALGTFNAFNQINVEKTRTNMTQSIADFRGGQGSKDAVKAAGEAYKNELRERQRLERDAYLAAVKEMAAQRGVSAKDLTDALSGTYGHYQDLKQVMPTGTQTRYVPGVLPGQAGRYEEIKVVQNDQERLGEALRHLNDTELQSLQALGAQAERTGNEIAQVDRQLVRTLNAKVPGSNGGGGRSGSGNTKTTQTELQQNQAKINALTQEYVRLGDMSTQSAEERKAAIQDEIEKLKERNGLLGKYAAQAEGRLMLTGSDINIQGLGNVSGAGVFDDAMKKAGEGIKITTPLQLDDKTIKKVQESLEKGMKSVNLTKEIGNISSGVGQVFGSLEQLGIDLPDGLTEVVGGMQSVISLLTGITSIITAIEAIAGADFIKPFAGGGVVKAAMGYEVPGNHYSGDLVPALLNSGETVLNRAQSGIIASALDGAGGGFKNGTVVGVLEGEKIKLVLNRHYRRIGEGEIVTWKNG